MYATLPTYWTTTASNYMNEDVKTNNWMYIGLSEWTISRNSSYGNNARNVYNTGYANNYYSVYYNYGARPVFYLDSSMKIKEGNGSATKPYRLEAE